MLYSFRIELVCWHIRVKIKKNKDLFQLFYIKEANAYAISYGKYKKITNRRNQHQATQIRCWARLPWQNNC